MLVWSLRERGAVRPLFHRDWVWGIHCSQRGAAHLLFSAAGKEVVSWDVEAGRAVRIREGLHGGKARAVQASVCGRFLFSGGADGLVHMMDERVGCMRGSEGGREGVVATWRPGSGGEINSLAFEDPWLVSAGADGVVALMDVRGAARDWKRRNGTGVSGGCRGRHCVRPLGARGWCVGGRTGW